MYWNKNHEVQNEYEFIAEIIMARKENHLTQQKLAELMGTKQSNISRFERGNYNPTLDFLKRIALAMGKKLEVRIV